MIAWKLILVPNDVEFNNDRMELILVPNDVELNNDRMELILVPNDVELNNVGTKIELNNDQHGVDIGTKRCRIK